MPKRVVVYCRVSTDAQERDGTSLDTQERACKEFAEVNGWEIVSILRDTASGFNLERHGLAEIRRLADSGSTDVVLAYALDRLSRKQTHVAILVDEMEERGVSLQFVTENFEDTATGQLLRSVKAFAAEFEREKIAERTMRGKAQVAHAGRLPQGTGRGIFGYISNPDSHHREINAKQGKVVQRIFEEFAAGASCHGISCRLNDEATPALGGGQWYPLTVRRILLNDAYTGKTTYHRLKVESVRDPSTGRKKRKVTIREASEWIDIPGATPPLVSLDLFERVQSILSDPDRRNRVRPSHMYLLRGRVHCGLCGTPMVGQALNKGRYVYYRCRHSYASRWEGHCDSKYIRKEQVEDAVRQSLIELLADPALILSEARRFAEGASADEGLQSVVTALQEVERKQERLLKAFMAGSLPEELLKAQGHQLNVERTRLERERNRLTQARSGIDLQALERCLPQAAALIAHWVGRAEGDDFDLLLRAVDAKVTVSAEEIRIEGTVPVDMSQNDLATIERTSA